MLSLLEAWERADAILARNEEYFPTPRSWYSAGEMNHGRISHSAALLNDGRVLAAGGYSGSAALASAELYNPTTLSWSETGGMNSARFQHSLTVLGNGLALAAGGSDGSAALASAELYHPESGSWSFTASMNLSRTEHFATRLNDTQVLVGGGWNGTELPYFSSSEIGSFVPANHLTGTLILPSGWIRSSSFTVQFSGDTSDATLKDGALSSDGSELGRMDWALGWSVHHQELGGRLRRDRPAGLSASTGYLRPDGDRDQRDRGRGHDRTHRGGRSVERPAGQLHIPGFVGGERRDQRG